MESTTEIIQESAEASMNEVEANVSGLVQYLQDHIPDMVSFGIRLLIALLIFLIGRFLIRWIRKSVSILLYEEMRIRESDNLPIRF